MLEPPDVKYEAIVAALNEQYNLDVQQIVFLPLGADFTTAVYQILDTNGRSCFLKLRRGEFAETAVSLPHYLHETGVGAIIPPLANKRKQLWGTMPPYAMILYPFVRGHNAYDVRLTRSLWTKFGVSLRQIHTAQPPPVICDGLQRERYGRSTRTSVAQFQRIASLEQFQDPIAREVAALLNTEAPVIRDLIRRADQYADKLRNSQLELVVCHSDLHAGNLFISSDQALYIVDWDEPLLAPKERDLMYIGGSLLASGLNPVEEAARFYAGYGKVMVDVRAIAYYRYERILQDIDAYCRQLLLSDGGGEDREQSLVYLKSNFLPGHTIEAATTADRTNH